MSKRDDILDAALSLFNLQGVEKTPTSAISKAANVATGTLFHHFKTKEDIISAVYLEIKLSLKSALIDPIQTLDLNDPNSISVVDIETTFQTVWFGMVDWLLAHPDKFLFLAQFSESAIINPDTRERVEDAFKEWDSLFLIGQSLGVFNTIPVELLKSLGATHMFTCSKYLMEHPGKWDEESVKEQLFSSCWRQLTCASNESLIKKDKEPS